MGRHHVENHFVMVSCLFNSKIIHTDSEENGVIGTYEQVLSYFGVTLSIRGDCLFSNYRRNLGTV